MIEDTAACVSTVCISQLIIACYLLLKPIKIFLMMTMVNNTRNRTRRTKVLAYECVAEKDTRFAVHAQLEER